MVKHNPSYAHPFPFELPDGNFVYLCPSTYHSVMILLDLFEKAGGTPFAGFPGNGHRHYPDVAYRLVKVYWAMKTNNISTAHYLDVANYLRLKGE